MRKRILLIDASILMLPLGGKRKRINLDRLRKVTEGMELGVMNLTVEELRTIQRKNKGKKGRAADLALELIEKMEIQKLPIDRETLTKTNKKREIRDFYDRALLIAAEKYDAAVATADLALKKKLRAHGIPVVFLRGGKKFSIEGT